MKRFRKKAAAIVLIMLAAAAATGTYASFSDTLILSNHLSVGDVNIGLEEFALVGKKEIPYENPRKVLPGDVISKIPRITNYAAPCWVRTRIELSDNINETEGLSEENLKGFSKKWIKRGEYYYYTEILEKNAAVDLFDRVEIPDAWSEVHSGQELSVGIRAEAVQASGFQPDFSAMSPWGNQKILLCIHEDSKNVSCIRQKVKLSVTFHGKAHKLLSVPSDFFANFGKLMPGEVRTDSAEISNTTEKDAELFFRIDVENQTTEQLKMLKELRLRIRMDGRSLYDGNLLAGDLNSPVSLGKFSPDDHGILDFSVEVPAFWDNSYALKEAEVKWIFMVQEDETVLSPSPEPMASGYRADEKKAEKTSPTRTGDESPLKLWGLLMGLSAVLGMVVFFVRKGGRHK